MDFRIRPIQKKDLQTLAEIYVDVYTKVDIGERWTVPAAKKLLEYWLDKQPDLALLAEYNGNIAGAFLTAIKPWWDGNHLMEGEIFVDSAFQKKGIGTELLKAVFRLR
jgi:L-amino acid N-acyltransferase YncA